RIAGASGAHRRADRGSGGQVGRSHGAAGVRDRGRLKVMMPAMNFCSTCGQPLVSEIPPGDHLPRYVCKGCGAIHYQNPKIVVGCVPEQQGRILICKRAIEPRLGYWTIPAGFMENDETLQEGAARECYEEALARVEIGSLLVVADILSARQVHVFFRA